MSIAPRASPSPRGVAVFDLDGTLTWRDTLLPFLAGYWMRHPSRWPAVWRVGPGLFGYLAGGRDRGLLKSRLIRMVMGRELRADIDSWAEVYVGGLRRRGAFRPAALATLERHRAAGDHLILLSASPDLYVPRIGRLLGFECTLCTELKWQGSPPNERLEGTLLTPNRRGEEKSRCLASLRVEYPRSAVAAYGNSASDLPHLRQVDHALLVNGSAAARRAAAVLRIAVADWQ